MLLMLMIRIVTSELDGNNADVENDYDDDDEENLDDNEND